MVSPKMRMLEIMEKYIHGIKLGERESDRFSKLKRVPNIYYAVLNNIADRKNAHIIVGYWGSVLALLLFYAKN